MSRTLLNIQKFKQASQHQLTEEKDLNVANNKSTILRA